MPKKEAVVLILDANESMATKIAAETDTSTHDVDERIQSMPPSVSSSSFPKTRFDCAKEASIAIISDLMVRSKTNEVTVLVLHTETTNNYFFDENDDIENSNDDTDSSVEESNGVFCPFPRITEISGNGEGMGIRQPLPGLLRKIDQLKPTPAKTSCDDNGKGKFKTSRRIGGDFESGLVYAADALHRRTAGKQFDRRIVLLTDAEHMVESALEKKHLQQRLLVALDSLRAMDCRIQVVGMDFKHAADFDTRVRGPSEIKAEQIDGGDVTDGYSDDDGDDDDNDDDDDDDDDEINGLDDDEDCDILEIKRRNEEYLIHLAHMTGGFVYASKELQDILQKVFGSRVVENPSKRKLVVEIAPGLVLEDARYYKLISKTVGFSLEKKLTTVDEGTDNKIRSNNANNALGDETLQDYETTITHWNAEDENEELQKERGQLMSAYRFGSDLLPFSTLDKFGLKPTSPVKLTILGYVSDNQIPHYLRIDSPYVLTGNESRRCCAAISALAVGLHKSKRVAIATFVKGVGQDPILCGLFPLVENNNETRDRNSTKETSTQQPLRLIIIQLPFSGDVRYPHLDYDDYKAINENNNGNPRKSSPATCCDDLIENLMLPEDTLDYKHIPNHRVRSFYKTVVKRVLDKTCDVVATRIDPASGIDSMDTPLEIRKRAQPAVAAFYESFNLKETRGTGL